jgi:chromate reductase
MIQYKLLAISGSIRKHSYNTAILRTLAGSFGDSTIRMDLFPLNEIPLYNQDIDGNMSPGSVVALRQAIRDAHGVVIASPEYNYGIPGVLKNALDWISRPYGESALTGKPVITLTASPAFTGGARAQAQLNDVLTAVAARLVVRPQAVVGEVHEKVQDGKLIDATTLNFLRQAVNDLIVEIRSPTSRAIQET